MCKYISYDKMEAEKRRSFKSLKKEICYIFP